MSSIVSKLMGMKEFLDGTIDSAPAFIAGDTIHCWEILKNRPGTAKIAVGFQNAVARSNFPGGDITGRENEFFYAAVSRGRGLTPGRADNLIYGSGGGLPLIALAEQMRDKLRAIRFDPNTDEPPDYVSLEDYTMEALQGGVLIDAMICKIWVGTQLPQPSTIASNQTPI